MKRVLKALLSLVLIFATIPIPTAFASNDSLWMNLIAVPDVMSKFIMAGTQYRGDSKPAKAEYLDKECYKFFGNEEISEYSGSKYTGRLYHENLFNNGLFENGMYITAVFNACAVNDNASPSISIGIEGETPTHSGTANLFQSEKRTLTGEWDQYIVTIPITSDLLQNIAGYRVVLYLGYYGQTTYISDFKLYGSYSSEFDLGNTFDKISIKQNDTEVEELTSGNLAISTVVGDNLKSGRLITALYNKDNILQTAAMSKTNTYSPSCTINVPEDAENYILKAYFWEGGTLKPVLMPETYKSSEARVCDFAMSNVACEAGIPATVAADAPLPIVSATANLTGEYKLVLNTPSESKQIAKEVLKSGETLSADLSDIITPPTEGEYTVELIADWGGESTYKDKMYFYIGDAGGNPVVYNNNELIYIPDYKGNRIPDYSAVGYKNGSTGIPVVLNEIMLEPSGKDDTARIQEAIDQLASNPLDENGFRGAILLKEGIWQISDTINISAGGIVIRGENFKTPELVSAQPYGTPEAFEANAYTGGTVILATSKEPDDLLFSVKGSKNTTYVRGTDVVDEYVPVGTKEFTVENGYGFSAGDKIILEQKNNNKWVSALGMDKIPDRDTPDVNTGNSDSGIKQWDTRDWTWRFERTITAVNGNRITIDIPIVNAIDSQFGTAKIYHYIDERISNVGFESLRAFALWSPDENGVDDTRHAQKLVDMDNVTDLWITNVTAEHFNTYCINLCANASRITVSDFYNLVALREYYEGEGYSGGRTFDETGVYVGRYGIYQAGQQGLFENIYGINNRHLIEYNQRAAGPNVAYNCESKDYLEQAGPHLLWSVGGLYDNFTGYIALINRRNMGDGHGWAGAWYTAWNTEGTVNVQKPPTAQNYSIGHSGKIDTSPDEDRPQGSVTYSEDSSALPPSLYEYQKNKDK